MKFDCLNVKNIIGFDWDNGNINKNEKKHNVKWNKIEEIFFNAPLLVVEDKKHSQDECRCFALGVTDDNNYLFIVFTKRDFKIRVISATSMNRKEKMIYENFKNDS